MHRTRSYRRHQNERHISNRLSLAKEIGHVYSNPSKLRKFNMCCTCGMCDINHPNGVHKAILSFKDQYKLKIMEERIIEILTE